MAVDPYEEDKPKIVFHAAMMAIQNFGFMTYYNDIWDDTPDAKVCEDTRFAVAFMSMTCFMVSFLCIGMAFGGYIGSNGTFALYWLLHLVGGACYTACTFMIPMARWSDDGKLCAAINPVNGERTKAIWYMHVSMYMVYVGGMLSITYFSFLKPTYFAKRIGI
mmetsp:Transcript_15746/g.49477  ORF Transcript_15746/g.49477 Transcript_15746/m.49477 type:complete len:163 (+) Transcript_15746:73-561(+)